MCLKIIIQYLGEDSYSWDIIGLKLAININYLLDKYMIRLKINIQFKYYNLIKKKKMSWTKMVFVITFIYFSYMCINLITFIENK